MTDVAITAGRLNPPTRGHWVLIQQLKQSAAQLGVRAIVYVVDGDKSSQDRSKNPLTAEQRVAILKEWFPDVTFDIVGSAYEIMEVLEVQNLTPVVWIAGTDRVRNYGKLLAYEGHMECRVEEVDRSAGDADGVSATLARKAALEDNLPEFARLMPAHVGSVGLERIMGLIKQAQVEHGLL